MVKNQIIFSRTQFIGILLGAIITGAVAGVFGAVRTLNTDHYTLIAVAKQIAENDLKDKEDHKTFVTRDELKELVIARMDRMQASIDRLR
jgi:hypothetical protein